MSGNAKPPPVSRSEKPAGVFTSTRIGEGVVPLEAELVLVWYPAKYDRLGCTETFTEKEWNDLLHLMLLSEDTRQEHFEVDDLTGPDVSHHDFEV